MISQTEKRNICNMCEWSHGREISIELKTGMKCVAARSIKSAVEFVFAHVKDTGRLAYWNLRGQRCSFSLWHGYLPTTFDYRCVWGGGVETGRLVYVWGRRET